MSGPESHKDRIIGAIDDINLGSDLLRTAWLATTSEAGLERDDVEAISATLYEAMKHSDSGRETLARLIAVMP